MSRSTDGETRGEGPVLLLSDIGPCSNYTGGVAMAQLCRLFAPGELVAFVVQNRWLKPEPYADLDWLPTETVRKPDELYEPTQWRKGKAAAVVTEFYRSTVVRHRLIRQALAFGRKHKTGSVWVMLEGQTVVRMAVPVARGLRAPLHSQIWDPLSWWLRAHYVDGWNSARAEAEFRRALTTSRACAAPSWAMADHIAAAYGVRSLPLIMSYPSELARAPARSFRKPDEVTIAMVGQFYASEAWEAFVRALDEVDWTIAGRAVRIQYFGRTPPDNVRPDRLTDSGWMETDQIIARIGEDADICYCPYPFTAEMEETARLSFPSKAVLYMASGKPVFFHGPHYASPAGYFAKNHAAVVCSSLDPYAVHGLFRWLVNDSDVYAATAAKAHEAFLKDFTLDRLRDSLDQFLERAA